MNTKEMNCVNKKNWNEMKQLLINEEKRRGQQVLNDEQSEYFKGAHFEVYKLLEYMKLIEQGEI